MKNKKKTKTNFLKTLSIFIFIFLLIKIAVNNFDIDLLTNENIHILRKKLYNKSPFSLKSINKYFGDLKKFKNEVYEWQKLNQ